MQNNKLENRTRRTTLRQLGTLGIGVSSIGSFAKSSTGKPSTLNECQTVGTECSSDDSYLDDDKSVYTTDTADGEYNLESIQYVSEYNSWSDPDYDDYTFRIHFGAFGKAFVDTGGEYDDRPSIKSSEQHITWEGDVVSSAQQLHEEAIGGYEYQMNREDEHDSYEDYAETVISGAAALVTAKAHTVTTILASMAVAYLLDDTENDHYYERIWDWEGETDPAGEGVSDISTFTRSDVTMREGDSVTGYGDKIVENLGSSISMAETNFSLTAPITTSTSSLSDLDDQTLLNKGLLKVRKRELHPTIRNKLFGNRPKEILEEHGEIVIGRESIVGQIVAELRQQRAK